MKIIFIILSLFFLSCNCNISVTHKIVQPCRSKCYIEDNNYYRQQFERGVLTHKEYQEWIERENRAYDILDSNKILYTN